MDFAGAGSAITGFAVSVARVGAAFLILPLLSPAAMPPLVRNVFLVALALAVFPLVGNSAVPASVAGIGIAPIVMKEAFIGAVIGYAFSIVFWAVEGAGELIDAKVGTTTAQIADPILGHQTSLFGTFFARFAAYVFVAFGGLAVYLDIVLQSYVVWPVYSAFPVLDQSGRAFLTGRFGEMLAMMLMLAAPALLILTVIELGLGFVNRYAQQLNVFSLSMSIKAWLAVFIVALMLATMGEYLLTWFAGQRDLLEILATVLGVAS